MLVAHHCSSKARFLFGAALGALMLSGCTGKDARPSLLAAPPASLMSDAGTPITVQPIASAQAQPGVVTIKPAVFHDAEFDASIITASISGADGQTVTVDSDVMVKPRPRPANLVASAPLKAATTTSIAGELKPAVIEAASAYEDAPQPTPGTSAWCRYLDAKAEAKNALLLSPTISGTVDDQTNASAKLSYDMVDIARARLEKQAAEAQCARFDAAGRISRMLFITPQSLTYAGNLAKANYLRSAQPELTSISKRINNHVRNGEMTAQLAAGLNQYIETVRSQEFRARAEAHRRETVGLLGAGDVRGLDTQLTEAERALAQIDRMSRTLDAVSVKLSAGISHNGNNSIADRDNNEFFDRDSAYAQVTVSYRLGAISPHRSKYERTAEEARVEALTENGHGALWRTSEMAAALARARKGLVVQRERIQSAIVEARGNARKFSRGYEIELNQSKYRAQVDVIKLTAELRGLEGTLADIDKVEQNLRFQ
jgi:hypothetical protein